MNQRVNAALRALALGQCENLRRTILDQGRRRGGAWDPVSREALQALFGAEAVLALDAGLQVIWRDKDLSDPLEAPVGSIPWLVVEHLNALPAVVERAEGRSHIRP